jgi:Tfp pilus assembly protein PilF
MSLIYEYLKIHGKNDSGTDPDVEIPPTLKRRDSNRLNSQSLFLLLGACLLGVLFIFFVFKIFNPGQDVYIANDTAPAAPVVVKADQPAEPVSTQQESVAMQEVKAPIFEQEITQAIQVFPETEKTAITAPTIPIPENSTGQPGTIRKKLVQPLELESKNRKITFPENAPVYTEPQESTDTIAVAATESYTENAAPVVKLHSSSLVGSAAREKSKKFYQAGLQAQHKGDGRIAEVYYKKALEEMPGNMEAMINLSALYVQQQRYAEAEKVLGEILAIEPSNSKALVNMGMISLNQDNESLAVKQFEAALAANPQEENALVNLAYIAEKNRDYISTEKYYRQLLQISPENLEVLLAYGHLLEEERRYPEAIALYGDTLELSMVKKDQRLYNKISERKRLLAGAVKNSQP